MNWFKSRIPKHAFILWVMMRNKLTKKDCLRNWGLSVPSDCLFVTRLLKVKLICFSIAHIHQKFGVLSLHIKLSLPLLFWMILFIGFKWQIKDDLQANLPSGGLFPMEGKKLEAPHILFETDATFNEGNTTPIKSQAFRSRPI